MKKLMFMAVICVMTACKKEQPPRDYAVIHGKITNPETNLNLRLFNPLTSESTVIKVEENGSFRDTLKLKEPAYYNAVYDNVFGIYLANDMDLEVNFDTKDFSQTLTFNGNGSAENEYLKYKSRKNRELMGEDYKEYLSLESSEFDARTSAFSKDLISKLEDKENGFRPTFVTSEKENIAQFEKDIQAQHRQQLEINKVLGKGQPSPRFADYLNYKGGTSSLEDFKGKYVYIDVWATWCVPCVYEMPYMNEIEKEYEGRNINFIGISIDR